VCECKILKKRILLGCDFAHVAHASHGLEGHLPVQIFPLIWISWSRCIRIHHSLWVGGDELRTFYTLIKVMRVHLHQLHYRPGCKRSWDYLPQLQPFYIPGFEQLITWEQLLKTISSERRNLWKAPITRPITRGSIDQLALSPWYIINLFLQYIMRRMPAGYAYLCMIALAYVCWEILHYH